MCIQNWGGYTVYLMYLDTRLVYLTPRVCTFAAHSHGGYAVLQPGLVPSTRPAKDDVGAGELFVPVMKMVVQAGRFVPTILLLGCLSPRKPNRLWSYWSICASRCPLPTACQPAPHCGASGHLYLTVRCAPNGVPTCTAQSGTASCGQRG